MKELAIIIPMYNEELNAERCVRAVCQVLTDKEPGSVLYVVNDGSADATGQILERLSAEELPMRVVSYPGNRGYGGAVLSGMKEAHQQGFTYGLVMDSDLTNDPALIPNFAARLREGEYDLIKASRFVRGGGMRGVPAYRQVLSYSANMVASLLFGMGLRDCTNGFRCVRLELIIKAGPSERGFQSIVEELYLLKRQRARVCELPYILTARTGGIAKSKFSYAPRVLWGYLRYALRARVCSGCGTP